MQSTEIPQGDRNPNGYTSEEILHELRGLRGSREVSFRYEHLDRNMNRIKDLDNILSGTVQMSYTSSIKRTATFTMRGDGGIDFLHDFIKPWYRLHMPPRWSKYRVTSDRDWHNSWNDSEDGVVVTSSNSESFGNPLTFVSGNPTYSRTRRIASSSSVRLGNASYIINTTSNFDTDQRLFKTYLYLEAGCRFQILWRDHEAVFFPGGTLGGLSVAIDDRNFGSSSYSVSFAGTSYNNASVRNLLVGKWIRLEVFFDRRSQKVVYRVFSVNPHGDTPDFEHTADYSLVTMDPASFELERPTGGGTHNDKFAYIGPVEFGDATEHMPQPVRTEKDYVEWPLGVFMMSTPTQTSSGDVVTREVEAFDRAKLFLDDKLEERMVIEKGEVYTDVMKNLLETRYPDIEIPYLIEPSTFVCGRTRQFEVGTEIKEVLDRIAESINYHTMQIDENGVVQYRKYVSPKDRSPEFDYSDNEISIMNDDVSAEFDIYEVANVWIVSLSETEGDPFYVKLENHDPANPFSIPRRGRRIVDFREGEEGADKNNIMAKAKRIQFEANRQFEGIEFTTLSNPLHSTNDCYTINFGPLSIKNKYTETGWEMDLAAGAAMTHSARRDVSLDPEMFDGFIDDSLVVNGSLTAGNIAWGVIQVPITKANTPQSVSVTGLNLKGTGRVDVFVTPVSSVPHNVKGVCSQEETPNGFKIWVYRATSVNTDVHWLAVRNV